MNTTGTNRLTANSHIASVSSTAVTPGNGARILQLDILRGAAILLVIAAHTWLWSPGWGMASKPAFYLVRCGWTGVDLFFVLSGFLIGSLLFKEIKLRSTLDVRRFLIRRGFKIWPSYAIFLVYVAAMSIAGRHGQTVLQSVHSLWPNLLHIQNYIMLEPRLIHTWSLAVEEHFYLALPVFLWYVLGRASSVKAFSIIPCTAVALTLLCTLGRIYHYYFIMPLPRVQPSSWTQLRIDALFFGVLLAYYHSFQPHVLERFAGTAKKRFTLFLTGLICVAPACKLYWGHPFMATVGITLLYIGYGAILLAMLYTPVQKGVTGRLFTSWPMRIIAWIGFYSYPIYLWHIEFGQKPVVWLIRRGFLGSLNEVTRWWALTFLFALLSIAAGVLFSMVIERPTLALRDRMFPSIKNKVIDQSTLQEAVARNKVHVGIEAKESFPN